jgi:hypothetical protein
MNMITIIIIIIIIIIQPSLLGVAGYGLHNLWIAV